MTRGWSTIAAIFCYGLSHSLVGGAVAADKVDYASQIKPLLAAKCYACHGVLDQQSELRLETRALMLVGGEGGQVLVPGDPGRSRLFKRITAGEEDRMPPPTEGARLTSSEIELIRDWIEQGAVAPAERTPADPRQHWAFQPPIRPEVPEVEAIGWSGNPIDAFLAEGHQRQGLVPLAAAKPQVLLRRVYLDLIGYPPTRAQLHAFLADPSMEAWQETVRQLLDRPAYGERWGRHWMDVWRYSDWYGLGAQVRYSQKHIWRWRDWIIQSLNEDKPYSRMVVEMLAGDEIAPTDPTILPATGFLARNYFLFNRTTWLDSTVEHTSKALLGLTLNCARCHDHKYDPLQQVDYYRMRAVFEPHQVRVDPVPGETDLNLDGLPRAFDNDPDVPTYLFVRGNEKQPDKSQPIEPGVPGVLASAPFQTTPVALPPAAYAPGLRPFALADHLSAAQAQIEKAQGALVTARQALAAAEVAAAGKQTPTGKVASHGGDQAQKEYPAKNGTEEKPLSLEAARATVAVAEKTRAAAELHPSALRSAHAADSAKAQTPEPKNLPQLVATAANAARTYEVALAAENVARAEQKLGAATGGKESAARQELAAAQKKLAVAQAALQSPGAAYTSLYVSLRAANGMVDEATPRHGPYSKVSTGRRTALARWIADSKNPLTARVAVNHIWLRHFGQPLVSSMTDFGLRTQRPVQHKLLDWLAVEFMEHNWSMKHLHELMVTSWAYQLDSSLLTADPSTRAADPDNDYYWRRVPLRMESQVIRDSMLHLAGVLEAKIGGPTVDPNKEDSLFRRSLYFTHSRDDRAKFMAMFDNADILRCYRRKESIIPQQALALANSKLALSMSRKIASVLALELGEASDEQFVKAAFETVLLVTPTEAERAACLAAMEQTKDTLRANEGAVSDDRVRQNLVHALLNHNDFVTIR